MGNSSTVRATTVGVLALAAGLAPLPMGAQAKSDTGRHLTFGLEQRFESTGNLALAPVSAGRTTQASTKLSFALASETAGSSLKLDGSAVLRVVNGPNTSGTDFALDDKRLGLAYSRSTGSTTLSISADLRDADVAYLRPFEDFINPDTGLIEPPSDFADLNGTGTRHTYGLNAALRWGEDAPLGFGLTAGLSKVSYSNTSSTELVDSRRTRLGADLRMDLSAATKATLGLSYSRFSDDNLTTQDRDTYGVSAGLALARPNGQMTTQVNLDHTPDGNRINLSFGRDIDLPTGSLSASLGVVKSANTGSELSGSLMWVQALPNGQFDAQLRRSVTAGSDDTDRLATALSVGYNHNLTPVSGLSLDLSYVNSLETATGTTVKNGSFEAAYNRQLTEDWGLGLGYRHESRETTSTASSSTVFLTLKRNFEFRP